MLSACGDSDSDTTASSPSSKETAASGGGGSQGQGGAGESQDGSSANAEPQGGGAQGDGSSQSDSGADSGSGPPVKAAPLKVSGGGSEQFREKGGDNSVQEFGEEGDEGELEDAATVLHGYFVARAERNWTAACSDLSKALVEQLESFASRTKQTAGEGCPDVLEAWTPPLPAAVREESTIVDAGSLRLEGERGFLIYTGAGGKVFTMPMTPEGDEWKVGALAPLPLS